MNSTERPCTKPIMRLGVGVAIPSLLQGFGVDPKVFLESRGFALQQFKNANTPVSYAALANLATDAACATECDHFGLLVGSAADLGTLGGLGSDARHAQTAQGALRLIIAQFDSHNRGAIMALEESDEACLSYSVIDPDVHSGEVIVDGAMAVAMRIISRLCGPTFRPSVVHLPRRPPKDKRPYERLFRCRVVFNMPVARISFERTWLDRTLPPIEDPSALHDDRLAPVTRTDFCGRVTVEVTRRLMSDMDVSADSVAHALGISRRTLHRELAKEFRTYHSVAGEVRFSYAKRLLHDTEMPLTKVAAEVGYSELSAFTRAFARTVGVCPSVWRETSKGDDVSVSAHPEASKATRSCAKVEIKLVPTGHAGHSEPTAGLETLRRMSGVTQGS